MSLVSPASGGVDTGQQVWIGVAKQHSYGPNFPFWLLKSQARHHDVHAVGNVHRLQTGLSKPEHATWRESALTLTAALLGTNKLRCCRWQDCPLNFTRWGWIQEPY